MEIVVNRGFRGEVKEDVEFYSLDAIIAVGDATGTDERHLHQHRQGELPDAKNRFSEGETGTCHLFHSGAKVIIILEIPSFLGKSLSFQVKSVFLQHEILLKSVVFDY